MEKNVKVSMLCEVYGNLLTKNNYQSYKITMTKTYLYQK